MQYVARRLAFVHFMGERVSLERGVGLDSHFRAQIEKFNAHGPAVVLRCRRRHFAENVGTLPHRRHAVEALETFAEFRGDARPAPFRDRLRRHTASRGNCLLRARRDNQFLERIHAGNHKPPV